MSFLRVLKGMQWTYLIKVGLFLIRHPLFAYATYKATTSTYRITQLTFPDVHGKENRANAFRHALWNMIIIKNAMQFTGDIKEAVLWAKKITDLHEELAPNKLLSKKMDLKNNALGRNWYIESHFETIRELVNFLLLKTKKAVKVTGVEEIESSNELVYLEE